MVYSASVVLPESRLRHSSTNILSHNLSFKIPISHSQELHLSSGDFVQECGSSSRPEPSWNCTNYRETLHVSLVEVSFVSFVELQLEFLLDISGSRFKILQMIYFCASANVLVFEAFQVLGSALGTTKTDTAMCDAEDAVGEPSIHNNNIFSCARAARAIERNRHGFVLILVRLILTGASEYLVVRRRRGIGCIHKRVG